MGFVNKTSKNSVTYDLQDARIQDDLSTASAGQLLGISSDKKIIPVDAPITGVSDVKVNGQSKVVSGVANLLVAELDSDGKVVSSQLPSYVDDVLEFASRSAFPTTGESGKIYVATDDNKTYRWSGSTYVEISASLALGETASTAYAGSKGKANADAISALQTAVGSKQDTISDLATIRSGAALGATALQEETYKGTVTSVNSVTPTNGNVTLSIPTPIAAKGTATRPVYISATQVATPCTYGFGIDSTGPYIESF